MSKTKEKKIAIFLDTRKESGGEYQHLIYTINNIKKNNNYDYKFVIVCLSKKLNLHLEKKFNLEIKYFSLNAIERYICYLRCQHHTIRRIRNFFFKNKFESFLKKNNIDLVYFTGPSQYSLYLEDTKFLITIPDVDHRHHMEFPEIAGNSEFERRDEIYSKALPKAIAIITNAEIIKKRLCYYYNLSEQRIHIISLRPAEAINNFVFKKADNDFYVNKYNLNKRYIYYPAMYLPHKNHKTVIDVIKFLKEVHSINFHAVFSGSDVGYKKNLLSYCKHKNVENLIHFIDFVDDTALPYIYKNAFAVVFPVLIGPTFTPVWESFKMEIPVIFSNLDGIKEVYGDAVVYVNPFDTEEIALAVKKLSENKLFLENLLARGRAQLENMNNNNSYLKIFEIIRDYRKISETWDS